MNESSTNDEKNSAPAGFLEDLTDGRNKGDWKTKYSPEAQIGINWEKKYLILLITYCLVLPLIIGIASKNSFLGFDYRYANLKKYIFGWFGGALGGTLFAIKWLVHSIAKDTWNIDRRLWRIFTPHLSASLAFVIILLINSEILKLADVKTLTIHKCYGIGFLVGYFSDNAIGKLTELAQVFFGSSLTKRK